MKTKHVLKAFREPEAIYRPAPFWSWNDHLDDEELQRQIDEMAKKGWGGYFMHSRVGLVTGYLSGEWMDRIRTCARAARDTGTYAWLYDEDKWPSGFAGGEVAEKEEYRARALVLLNRDEVTENDTIMLELKDNGSELCICRRVSPLGSAWFNGACYVDLMNPEAVRAFIQCTHERYKEACGEYFGKEIPGIFTDEPCYLMQNQYNVPTVPWSDYIPDFFRQLKGYSIEDHLTELFFDQGDYRRVRYDFYDTAVRLFVESFTKPYYQWCEDNNLKMTGHFMAEDSMLYQIQWIGAAMPHYEFMHWPGIDKLGRNLHQLVTVKQVTSAADQLGKERSFCEVFGCIGQQSSFYHRKWIADWQAVLGISFVNSHLSLYSMRGERKRDYPANLFYQQPWWEEEKKFADYIGRLSYTVSRGKRDVDILVLHPIASVWSEYSPLHKENSFKLESELYDRPFDQLSRSLISHKLDFHYGDETIMENHARVENGRLVVGQHAYSTVVVPPSVTLKSNTVRLLKEFVKCAGPERLILMTLLPERVDGVESPDSLRYLEGCTKAGSVEHVISALDALYLDRIRITDISTGENADKVICQQRTSEEGKYILVANTDEEREVTVTLSLPAVVGQLMALDLASGSVYRVPSEARDGRTDTKVKFYPAGSLLLFEPVHEIEARDMPAFLGSGAEFMYDFTSASGLNFVCSINEWNTTVSEPNVLPLNDVTLILDGKKVLQDEPVAKAWHKWFYNAPDGTPFEAQYTFEVLNIPEGEVFAAVETAENLDLITLNNVQLKPLKAPGELGAYDSRKSWKDINFTRVPLSGFIKKGTNTLVLKGRKVNNITGPGCHIRVDDFINHRPTEVETVYIVGNFSVKDRNRIKFMMDGRLSAPDFRDLTDSGYPFYAGWAEFVSSFNYQPGDKRVYLRIDPVKAACVVLYINGKRADVKYWEPYVFDVTGLLKEGENEVRIAAASTLFNLMGPNRIQGIGDSEYVSPGTFVDFDRFTSEYQLLPFGIGACTILEG